MLFNDMHYLLYGLKQTLNILFVLFPDGHLTTFPCVERDNKDISKSL